MKTLIFMQGCPGSMKSTLAKTLRKEYEVNHSCVIVSTDNFFLKDGKYEFSPTKLGINHEKTRQYVLWFMKDSVDYIILDNTNIRLREYKPYLLMALLYGYEIEILRPKDSSPQECFLRNQHGVPWEKVEEMYMNRVCPTKVYELYEKLKEIYYQST